MKKAEPKTPCKKSTESKAKPATRRPRKTTATAKKTTRRVTFSITAAPGLPVYVAGSFNNWDPESIPLVEKDGVYSTALTLEPGEYEYKFIVNGFWTMDPDTSREWRANGLGTLNSVLTVE